MTSTSMSVSRQISLPASIATSVQNSPKKGNCPYFTLFWSAKSRRIFPNDPEGDFKVIFKKKSYVLRRQNCEYSSLLQEFLKQNPYLKSHEIKFTNLGDIEAFDIVMKLLFGFKDVEVPVNYLIQVCSLVIALGINNEENFQERIKAEMINHINEDNILEAYQMSIYLNDKKIETLCLSFLQGFDIVKIFDKDQFYQLTEEAFCGIMELHMENKKNINNTDAMEINKFINTKQFIQILTRYCNIHYIHDPALKQQKFMLYMKNYFYMHETEDISNLDQLFMNNTNQDILAEDHQININLDDSINTNDIHNDSNNNGLSKLNMEDGLHKQKFQALYVQLKKLDNAKNDIYDTQIKFSEDMNELQGNLNNICNDLTNRIDCVKKLCLEDNRNQTNKLEQDYKESLKVSEDKFIMQDNMNNDLKENINETKNLLTKESQKRKLFENRIRQKIKAKMMKENKKYEMKIDELKEEISNQKNHIDCQITMVKDQNKKQYEYITKKLENFAKDLLQKQQTLDQFNAEKCNIF